MKIEYLSESFSIKYVKVDHVIYKVSFDIKAQMSKNIALAIFYDFVTYCFSKKMLSTNQIIIYSVRNSVFDIIHTPYPFNLVVDLQLLVHALTLCYLFYQLFKHILCLPVNIRKIAV